MSKPPDTVFVQGSSGSIIKMDVPTNPHAHGNYKAALESGELRLIDPKLVTEATTRHGGAIYVLRDQPEPEPQPAPKKAAAKKRAADPEPSE